MIQVLGCPVSAGAPGCGPTSGAARTLTPVALLANQPSNFSTASDNTTHYLMPNTITSLPKHNIYILLCQGLFSWIKNAEQYRVLRNCLPGDRNVSKLTDWLSRSKAKQTSRKTATQCKSSSLPHVETSLLCERKVVVWVWHGVMWIIVEQHYQDH